jgi:8-oxo-dGTP diphosphatase
LETTNIQVVVAAALMNNDNCVLMQCRPAHKQHGGLWEFPGGKVDQGETTREAIVREIVEELGVTIDPANLFEISFAASERVSGKGSIVLLLYGCREWRGDPRCLEDGAAVAWYDIAAVQSLSMPPLDVPLAQALLRLSEPVTK